MPKPTSAVKPLRAVIITLDNHLASAVNRARATLRRDIPGLELSLHAATDWTQNPATLADCRNDIARGDIIIANMLFMEDHIQAVLPALEARRDSCNAMVGFMSAGEVIKLTRLGKFKMDGTQGGFVSMLKRLRGSSSKKHDATAGAKQLAMLKRLPQILRFIPGAAQDVRAYFLSMQYWLAGSEDNVVNLVKYLASRYSGIDLKHEAPKSYPEVGVYHPRLPGHMADTAAKLPAPLTPLKGTVGLLLMRSYVLAGDTGHYDGVIAAFEAKGLKVVPAFATGLDSRPAIEKFFIENGKTKVDAVVSLNGFSLVGGPAYNDAKAAEEVLAKLDVPYVAAQPVEFQTIEEWEGSDRGLHPIETTMMIAIPEIDGSTGSIVFGGRSSDGKSERAMRVHPERARMLANRVAKLVALRRSRAADRKIAIVLFNFPPNSGSAGTAAFLAVFESLFNTMKAMKSDGYNVDVPKSIDDLRDRLLKGNAERFGTDANVHMRISADDHVRREVYLKDIEAQWGAAPGKQQSDGASIHVLGERFGDVFVGLQPAFGYEGDPMRLLFEKGFAPTHAFSAFYRWIREDFGAHAVLHFGTHGALEFMPGKQSGLSDTCWPDRLIGDLPNLYLYAANNPSEGTIAKRRSGATLVSYLTPPIAHAGLYRGLADLKSSLERYRGLEPGASDRAHLAIMIQAQASVVNLAEPEPGWPDADARIAKLADRVLELEYTLIPHGLHVVGEAMSEEARRETLATVAETSPEIDIAAMDKLLAEDHELAGLLRALEGRYIRPVPGGDLLRTPAILPTGRNLHGFDPFRIPSAFAVADGRKQAELLLATHMDTGQKLPETVALVLWGTDNLKSEGGPVAQALALMGAKPRFDSFGRLCGAALMPLEELGRPRVDVVMTLSGIFRDLLPLQTRMLAEASFLAASADEPLDRNFVRKHALAHMAAQKCDLETAALRVFSNADGAYGANVNLLVDSGRWDGDDEIAEVFTRRKCFAHGRSGQAAPQAELMKLVLSGVELAYQNLESVELGVTTIDHYFDTLGGISRAVERSSGKAVPVYIGDQTRGAGQVRTLADQVALETRTRALNPKWYEGMLKHGHEGVRQIEAHLTNTVGWSATTGQVAPWVYQQFSETYVLDEAMRKRLADLNPKAAAKFVNRLLEAHDRDYWKPDAATLDALRRAGDELEDKLEGIDMEAAA
jgi:magnesium chelatase subunit H